RVVLHIDDKFSYVFEDLRNFGTLKLTDDKNEIFNKFDSMAPDLIRTKYSAQTLIQRFKEIKSKKLIVVLLMDQTHKSVVSGIGNYMVAEILYRAKISP